MSIFAMALSYTDSYRYSSYIVTLAHQIIADWFTRCRLTYRKGFVTLIAKALKSSTMINADREKREGIKDNESNSEIKIFHQEMTHVCLDMMARYSFSSRIRHPRRTQVMEFLLSDGTSQTWLAGNMLITITTCSSIPGHCSSCCVAMEGPSDSCEDITRHSEIQTLYTNKKADFVDLDHNNPEAKIDEKSFCSYEYIDSEEREVELTNKNGMVINEENDRSSVPDMRDRRDSAALVTKLTEMLANPETDMRMFSPSETLLFSRQGSKSAGACNNTGEDEDEDVDEDEDEEEDEDEDKDDGKDNDDLEDGDKSENEEEKNYADNPTCICRNIVDTAQIHEHTLNIDSSNENSAIDNKGSSSKDFHPGEFKSIYFYLLIRCKFLSYLPFILEVFLTDHY